MKNVKYLLIFLFVLFGSYAMINPIGISLSNLQKSYSVSDLIRGWGIYSITIGALLYDPEKWISILILCFLISILWHIEISCRNDWTPHHKHSIIINLLCLLVSCIIL